MSKSGKIYILSFLCLLIVIGFYLAGQPLISKLSDNKDTSLLVEVLVKGEGAVTTEQETVVLRIFADGKTECEMLEKISGQNYRLIKKTFQIPSEDTKIINNLLIIVDAEIQNTDFLPTLPFSDVSSVTTINYVSNDRKIKKIVIKENDSRLDLDNDNYPKSIVTLLKKLFDIRSQYLQHSNI